MVREESVAKDRRRKDEAKRNGNIKLKNEKCMWSEKGR